MQTLNSTRQAADGNLRGGSRLAVGALQLGIPAVVIGAGAGLAAVAFRWLISSATLLFTGMTDYAGVVGHPPNHWVPWLGAGFVCIVPVIGGLLYGPLVSWLAPEARGHGVPEVMLAVAKRGGRIRPRVAVVKALASAVCIGSGGSVGREGPIIQIGSALGSAVARLTRSPEDRVRALVACGAAGGIAATFNAPIAGVFFALELLLRDFAARSFGAVMLASITASLVGRSMLGNSAFLHLPAMQAASPWEYALFALLGLLAGALGMGFTRFLYLIEDACDRLWHGPEWLRPVVGGVLIGLILLALPQMYGVGYPVLDAGVRGRYAIAFLLILLVGKMVATSLTLGVGGSGGVFAPSLFIGAMFGEAFGQLVGHLDPALAGQAGVFALVGMGAVLAGTTRAPITAGIMLFELTGDYGIILPLLLAIILATAMSRFLGKDTIYTLKLRRRGIDLDVPTGAAILGAPVRELMEPPLAEVAATEPPASVARTMLLSGRRSLAVTGPQGEFLGVVTMRSLSEALGMDDDPEEPGVADLLERTATVAESDTLASVLEPVLEAGELDGLPVADEHGNSVGWLSQEAVLRALAEHTGTVGR